MTYKNITRVEVIDLGENGGRAYTNYNVSKVEESIQDNGKTLKLFITTN